MIILKNENEIDLMRKAGKILGETLNLLKEKVRLERYLYRRERRPCLSYLPKRIRN